MCTSVLSGSIGQETIMEFWIGFIAGGFGGVLFGFLVFCVIDSIVNDIRIKRK